MLITGKKQDRRHGTDHPLPRNSYFVWMLSHDVGALIWPFLGARPAFCQVMASLHRIISINRVRDNLILERLSSGFPEMDGESRSWTHKPYYWQIPGYPSPRGLYRWPHFFSWAFTKRKSKGHEVYQTIKQATIDACDLKRNIVQGIAILFGQSLSEWFLILLQSTWPQTLYNGNWGYTSYPSWPCSAKTYNHSKENPKEIRTIHQKEIKRRETSNTCD